MSERTERLCDHYADHMMRKRNVVGVAGGDDKLLVFVTRKQPLSALATEDVVDEQVSGVETDVIEVGTITPMNLVPGSSIGLPTRGTGTLGAPVIDEHRDMFILTNNHVAADSNRAVMLSDIVHPGPADGVGYPIGKLDRYVPILFDAPNRIDAALVRVNNNHKVSVLPSNRPATGRTGWRVYKTGRTSGRTQGRIIGRNATIDVDFGSQGVARFINQLVTTNMLEPGDSGSVLLSWGGYPVGLCFAGSSKVSIHNPAHIVLRTLAVKLL